jgi:hypothetical protein
MAAEVRELTSSPAAAVRFCIGGLTSQARRRNGTIAAIGLRIISHFGP